MHTRTSNGRLTRLVILVLALQLCIGLWQGYGRWLVSLVRSHAG